MVCKTGENKFRCQFFYSEAEQYGTGRDEYDDFGTCVLTLLQVQSDHERQLANVSSGATAASLNAEDYHGSLVAQRYPVLHALGRFIPAILHACFT